MSLELEELSRQGGLRMASHIWTTTVASFQLIASPSTGRAIWLHYIAVHQSAAAGLLHLSNGTTAGTTHWTYNAAGPHVEEALIQCDAENPIELHMAATGGAGFIRVYYSVRQAGGTRE